ncbi:hypothetical protein INT44_006709 [Umbelopsis vinacea]|uniref:FYVE-type domain-containing protein n=1 Tax=Umbelopsis vinacea TaxID=44442 RepID=A0A8H7PIB3_9FUNG|nr:hypothetical protein INT44_006709 [Umbelopsis vinacea]
MTASVAPFTMDFIHPPIAGQVHQYYGSIHNTQLLLPAMTAHTSPKVSPKPKPKPESTSLYTAASNGNLQKLKELLNENNNVNQDQPITGLTLLHFAASRGHLEVTRSLCEEYGALTDIEDREGETALLKAAYNGHFPVVQYLVQDHHVNIHHKDKDGWTALHNACSRGHSKIVRFLVERGARIDVRSKMGHTPLINAASKGYMSIVEYLVDEAHANPLIKNSFGEAAYDVSAAAGESYICEMLEKAEKQWWDRSPEQGFDISIYTKGKEYDPLEFHVTVTNTLHENQRSSSVLSNFGLARPSFSAAALSKADSRGPWSDHATGKPKQKEEVRLPSSSNSDQSHWFWLTDWQIDYSDPRVDPTSGWQYAKTFDDADDRWTPVAPGSGSGWVRRRRWVRVMKRRMDLVNGGHQGNQDALVLSENARRQEEEDEQGDKQDYLYRAEAIVRKMVQKSQVSKAHPTANQKDMIAQELRSLTQKLRSYEESIQILLAGIKSDQNQRRKKHASNLVNIYLNNADKLNKEITELAPQLTTPITSAPVTRNAELERELGFFDQPSPTEPANVTVSSAEDDGSPMGANPWSQSREQAMFPVGRLSRSNTSQSAASMLGSARSGGSGISQAFEPLQQEATLPRTFKWEPDSEASDCRRCNKRFGLLNRRHHCRRCGLVVCDKCSTARTFLPANQILKDPHGAESLHTLASQHHRVCDKCYADLGQQQ